MKNYTDTIPLPLAEKLKERGMPMESWQGWGTPYIAVMEDSEYDWLDKELGNEPSKVERRYAVPTYAEVFDWLMEKGKEVEIFYVPARGCYMYGIAPFPNYTEGGNTWHEAATKTIEKALTLIERI